MASLVCITVSPRSHCASKRCKMHWLARACVGDSLCALRHAAQQLLDGHIVACGSKTLSALAASGRLAGKPDASSIEAVLGSATDMGEPNAASLLSLYSTTHDDNVITVAGQCGANLAGQELRRLKQSFSTSYPEVPQDDLLYPPGVLEDTQMQVIRRHNISMPCKHNQRIYGTVYAYNEDRAWVDVGHSSLAIFNRSVRAGTVTSVLMCPLSVTMPWVKHAGCLQELLVTNLAPPKDTPVQAREHANDIRIGDRFVFRIQELKCPLGSVWLEPQRRTRAGVQAAVWEELKRHHASGDPVGGRILNDVNGGLAVGIAGVVALLPWNAVRQHSAGQELCKKLGALQPFVVTSMNPKYRECFVRFPATEQRRRFDRHS